MGRHAAGSYLPAIALASSSHLEKRFGKYTGLRAALIGLSPPVLSARGAAGAKSPRARLQAY